MTVPNLRFNKKYWNVFDKKRYVALLNYSRHRHTYPDATWVDFTTWQKDFGPAIDDVFASIPQDTPKVRYGMDCSMAITAVWLKAQVDVCRARGKNPDSLFCKSWVTKEGFEACNNVAIVNLPRWEVGLPKKQKYNLAMRIARHERTTLLPGEWFGVEKTQENWLYIGNNRYFGHGARQYFNLSDDVGPISEVEARGKIMPRKHVIDVTHFLQLMK